LDRGRENSTEPQYKSFFASFCSQKEVLPSFLRLPRAMNRVSRRAMSFWAAAGTRYLPFADAATADLPLSRLLRLSLFQVSVGMALTLLIGTLNRVMIVELGVPASLVGVMIALPLIFAPFRALIGFKSDTHASALGWKRVPFIFRGSMIQFGGLAIMPFALLVLSGGGNASQVPAWVGCAAAGIAFLLTGAGLHTTQTVGLALATDLAPPESQPQVVGLMYVMLLFGMIVSALCFGTFLSDFSPFRLVQVVQASALLTLILNTIATWKQEPRGRAVLPGAARARPSFQDSWDRFMQGRDALRRLIIVGFGTMAFSMEDVLLEPYGGQVLHLAVGQTTRLTATLAIGGLFGFGLASRVLSRGFDPFRMARYGCIAGLPAFLLVILAAPAHSLWMFAAGTFLIGFGAGLFGHGTLTATMRQAPRNQTGLALGAWGAVQATAAGVAIACGGIFRDLVYHYAPATLGAAAGYDFVYSVELALLFVTLVTMFPIIRQPANVTTDAPLRPAPSKGFSMKLSRLYDNAADAAAAVAALKTAGFRDGDIETVTAGDKGWISADTLRKHEVAKDHAEPYAAALRTGKVLVLVNPLLGWSEPATKALAAPRGGENAPATVGFEGSEWDEAAPLSSALFLPVLSKNPTPFGSFWNVPTLAKRYWFFSNLFGFKLLTDDAAPLSKLFGLKTLSSNPAPFSTLLRWPTLTKSK
jgi:BCD family chlorophyll transporter-like MFS transporter